MSRRYGKPGWRFSRLRKLAGRPPCNPGRREWPRREPARRRKSRGQERGSKPTKRKRKKGCRQRPGSWRPKLSGRCWIRHRRRQVGSDDAQANPKILFVGGVAAAVVVGSRLARPDGSAR